MSKRKVLVLGGGAGALSAAFELTATPELRERFEVTVLQTGWRLGGKGASGRRADRNERIEEHGLHVWFGFYREAFGLIERAYAELGPDAPATPWTDAFSPIERLVLWDLDGDERRSWSLRLPAADFGGVPTTAPDDPARSVADRLVGLWEDLLAEADDAWGAAPAALKLAKAVANASPANDALGLRETARLLRTAVQAQKLIEGALPGDPPFALRVLNRLLDLWAAVMTGIVEDEVLRPPGDFDPNAIASLDELDFREWLAPRVRFDDTLDMSFVRVLYDLAFAYEDGDPGKPDVAAGMALENLFRILFGHDGALMLRMEGGMGDVIFAPLYLALRKRGVQFRFFHHVTGLGVSADGEQVESVDVVEQATLAGTGYDPLVTVGGQPCWPSTPALDQLAEGTGLRDSDLEREPNPLARAATTLRRGTDFDDVVLGIPAGALPQLCEELAAADPEFDAMLANARTVATQALQLWLSDRAEALGDTAEGGIAGGLAKPFDTCCDMTHLVKRERWPAGSRLHRIAYLCGVLPEPRKGIAPLTAVRTSAETLVESLAANALIGPAGAEDGALDDQWWRANDTPTERYVLTPAGSVKHRLAPGESGFANLVLAGDWTRTPVNAGSVEAAVQSGRAAAAALIAGAAGAQPPGFAPRPLKGKGLRGEGVRGEGVHEEEQPPPAYVEYGGLTSAPGPLSCDGTTLYGFWARCDRGRMRRLCERVFDEPTHGAISVEPLFDQAIVTFGLIDRIRPQTRPFDAMGVVAERHAAIWIPVRCSGPPGTPAVGVFLPYLWLDDPISIASGREVYGYAKNYGWPRFVGDGTTRGRVDGDAPDRFKLDAYAIRRYGHDEKPARRKLLEIERGGLIESLIDWATPDDLGDVLDIARSALGALDLAAGELTDLTDDAGALKTLLRTEVPQLFLRQFRSPDTDGAASRQQIVTAPARIVPGSFRAQPLGPYRLTVSDLDSHPLTEQLGLASGALGPAFKVEMDFVVERGRVLWESP